MVRNLAGRLNARSPGDLTRIAAFWQIPVSGRDRHTMVGQLYREMRDLRTARDLWQALEEGEREVVRVLALGNRAAELSVTVDELAGALHLPADETYAIAAGLFRKGIVAREGDDSELPIGEVPRIFLPRELSAVFRRIQDEIDAGEIGLHRLPALLALLDDAEVETAAGLWGFDVVPGLHEREELVAHLVAAIGSSEQRKQVLKRLSPAARGLWTWMSERDATGPIALVDALEAMDLDEEGPTAAHQRRDVLTELETRLLVWHEYIDGEQRALFIPVDFRQPAAKILRSVEQPARVDASQVRARPWIVEQAIAWDLLTLMRALQDPGSPAIRAFDRAPDWWLSQLNARLWNSSEGEREPPAEYLAFLAALGRNENVLEAGDAGTGEALKLGRAWKFWRTRSFADQMSHLLWWWRSSAEWIEGLDRGDIVVTDAEWPLLRQKMVVMLAGLDPWSWYRLAEVARWVVKVDPDIAGSKARIATSSALPVDTGNQDWPLDAGAAVVEAQLRSVFRWLAFVETGTGPNGEETLKVTDALRQFETGAAVETISPLPGAPLVVADDLSIELRSPTPLRVWALSAFADQVELRPSARYQLSQESIERTLSGGAGIQDVIRFLEREAGEALPETASERLRNWAGRYRRAWLQPALVVELDETGRQEEVGKLIRESGFEADVDDRKLTIRISAGQRMEDVVEQVVSLLRSRGFTMGEREPPSVLPPESRSDGG